LLELEEFRRTEYFENAMQCIDIFGRYFDIRDEEGVRDFAVAFIDRYEGRATPGPLRFGQSSPGSPVRVRPIAESDLYEVVDGHHRTAIAEMRGEEYLMVQVEGPAVYTPLQTLLFDVEWTDHRRELQQPVAAPELRNWILARRCQDHLDMMTAFLRRNDLLPPEVTSYLDIASRYGWFVAQMSALGFEARGVERNPSAAAVGVAAYRIPSVWIARSDCVRYLRSEMRSFDVVSCLGLLHHFVLGEGGVSAEELIRLIDSRTGRVLFIDTGECHEARYAESLRGWTPDFVEQWLREHTTFSRVVRLGTDSDRILPNEKGYGRTLFACSR
jgi:SAM-dependent methyltransferase